MKLMRMVFFFLSVALVGAMLGGVAAAANGRPMPPIITTRVPSSF
ncbi:MAG TPA: hypothetical protein VK191_06885 [Symbiobacteriaceae bacterium]|nr:hypothetical protein [Symbiobacteriaceae bacterium]